MRVLPYLQQDLPRRQHPKYPSGAVIGPHCSRCLACLHWCPHQAVTVHGKTVLPQDQYHHPDVTIRDMMVR